MAALRALLAFFLVPLFGPALPGASPGSALPPLPGEWIEPLGDLGYVAVPTGATEPRPVIVAVHGAYDRPDWACGEWRAVFGPRPFIVCPHGAPRAGGGFVWSGSTMVRREIDRALDAASAQYGAYLDRSHRIYVGFSQGAILGARVVKDDAKDYPYAIFQEGWGDEMATRPFADAMKRAGVKRVLLGCSQAGCVARREPARASLVRAGIDARVNDAGQLGHVMDPRVYASLHVDISWLLAGDPAWAAVVRDVEAEKM